VPHEQLNEQQVADYLRMDLREVVKLASRGQLPCRKVGDRFVFHKGELDHWAATRLHEWDRRRLAEIERGVSEHHGFNAHQPLLVPLIPAGGVAVPLLAKTREATLRALVELAEAAELVYIRDELLAALREREDLCSTALMPGVAMPHPRLPVPYDIAESFVTVGLTASGIPYGAEDGSLTRLFFLVCCKDDRTHLHVLARLAQILQRSGHARELLACETPEELLAALRREERAVLAAK